MMFARGSPRAAGRPPIFDLALFGRIGVNSFGEFFLRLSFIDGFKGLRWIALPAASHQTNVPQ
jgi:hypothetical protein